MPKKLYPRYLEKIIENWLFKNMVIILYGARRVGKTTMVQNQPKYSDEAAIITVICQRCAEFWKVKIERDKNYIGEKEIGNFDERNRCVKSVCH